MRRVLALLLGTATLLYIAGCGAKSYETRLDETLNDMKYQDRLNRLLLPPLEKKWHEMSIYLRPPKNLVQSKAWALAPTEPGKFDLEASFNEPSKQDMHVLVRVKRSKGASKKGAAPNPADTVDRTNFTGDVLAVLNDTYKPAEELVITKFKAETKKKNEYKFQAITANDKNIQIYFYKQEPYDVALVFEYPKSEQASLFSKIGLCLESFAVGERAGRIFAGKNGDEESSEDPGAPVVPTT
jgi:hypothetical protein